MKITRWLWILAAVLVVAALVMVRARRVRERYGAEKAEMPPVAVQLAPVSSGTVSSTRHILGTVIGSEEAEVAARVMASVLEVRVREGDPVTKGQILIQLDPRELKDAVAQAQAGLAAAREALAAAAIARQAQSDATARDSVLFAAQAIAREQWDRSRAARAALQARWQAASSQVEVASRRLDQARTRLSYTRLSAPFSGVVSSRHVDPGDLATPGRPLVGLVRQTGVRVRAALPPEDWSRLKVGQTATLTLNDAHVEARISRVFPALGRSHLAQVEFDLKHPPAGFVSGATVGVDLVLHSAQGMLVPNDAVLESERGDFVFVARADTLRAVPVHIQVRGLQQVIVTGPIQVGDPLVVARPSRLMALATGMHVRPVQGVPSHPSGR